MEKLFNLIIKLFRRKPIYTTYGKPSNEWGRNWDEKKGTKC